MPIRKNIKFTDYVKLSEMKNYLMMHLDSMGLKEIVRTMNDDDLEKLMYMMSLMGEQLRKKDTNEERIEMLIAYVICLWTRLIVEHGVGLEEL